MARRPLPPSDVGVGYARRVSCPTVALASTAGTCSSSEEVGGANKPVSGGVVQTWPSRMLMREKRTSNKISKNW